MFGDTDAYKDKFKTCARARPINCKLSTRNSTIKNSSSTYPRIKPCIKCAGKKKIRN